MYLPVELGWLIEGPVNRQNLYEMCEKGIKFGLYDKL